MQPTHTIPPPTRTTSTDEQALHELLEHKGIEQTATNRRSTSAKTLLPNPRGAVPAEQAGVVNDQLPAFLEGDIILQRVDNHIIDPVARRMPGFGIVVHTGRKTQRKYHTPVAVFRSTGVYVLALAFGRDADWMRNVVANGGCVLEARGRPSHEWPSNVCAGHASVVNSGEPLRALPLW